MSSTEAEIALKHLFYCFEQPDSHHFSSTEPECKIRFNE